MSHEVAASVTLLLSQGLYKAQMSGEVRNRKCAITCSNEESPGDIGESSFRKKAGTGAGWEWVEECTGMRK